MRVLIAQRPGAVEEEQEGRVPLSILLPQVDVLSLHCPLTPETRGLIGAWELALMRRDAIPVSYTHLDVYKRQLLDRLQLGDQSLPKRQWQRALVLG